MVSMSIHVSSAVWRTPVGDPYKKAILLKLADNCNDDGMCWPSIRTIAQNTEISKSTVCEKLKQLEEEGWLIREQKPFMSTAYFLSWEKFKWQKDEKGVVRQPDRVVRGADRGGPPRRQGVVRGADTNCKENHHLPVIESSEEKKTIALQAVAKGINIFSKDYKP